MSKNIDGVMRPQEPAEETVKPEEQIEQQPTVAPQKARRKRRLSINEKTRTLILILLLVLALGFIYSVQSSVDSNFVETL